MDAWTKPFDDTAEEPVFTTKTVKAHCHIHGDYEYTFYYAHGKTFQTRPECPACQEIARRRAWAEKARQEKAEREKRILLAKGIPEEFLTASLENFIPHTPDQENALATCKRFLENWERVKTVGAGILFYGNCGTGKTHLAISLLKALPYENSRYVQTPDLFKAVYQGYSTNHDAIQEFRNYTLLILDEVGIQKGSDHEREKFFQLLDYRFTNRKPTILITNLDKPELAEMLKDRIYDRIRKHCKSIRIAGTSERTPIYEGVF